MAASRGHPLISRVVTDMVQALQALAANAETSTAELLPTDDEVGQTSGPVIWTRAVLKTLSEATGTEVSWWSSTGITEPREFGDEMVLPVNWFGTGRLHSGSVREGFEDAFVKHRLEREAEARVE